MKFTLISIGFGILLQFTHFLYAGEQKADTTFSHKRHVIEEQIECLDCHSMVNVSRKGTDDLFPTEEVCLDCHDQGEVVNPATFSRITAYNPKFSHQKHLEEGLECQSCHSGISEKESSAPYLLPQMMDCLSCHQTRLTLIECNECHLPSENLRPASHTPAFLHNHGDMARAESSNISVKMDCSVCHRERFCQDCHEGDNLDRFTHPVNFEFTHSLQAMGKEKDCAVCHTQREFCIDCHKERQILPHSHSAGWVNNIPNDGGRHRQEAEIDLDSCISCHEEDAQQICQPCHGQ